MALRIFCWQCWHSSFHLRSGVYSDKSRFPSSNRNAAFNWRILPTATILTLPRVLLAKAWEMRIVLLMHHLITPRNVEMNDEGTQSQNPTTLKQRNNDKLEKAKVKKCSSQSLRISGWIRVASPDAGRLSWSQLWCSWSGSRKIPQDLLKWRS